MRRRQILAEKEEVIKPPIPIIVKEVPVYIEVPAKRKYKKRKKKKEVKVSNLEKKFECQYCGKKMARGLYMHEKYCKVKYDLRND